MKHVSRDCKVEQDRGPAQVDEQRYTWLFLKIAGAIWSQPAMLLLQSLPRVRECTMKVSPIAKSCTALGSL